jgi:lysozyme
MVNKPCCIDLYHEDNVSDTPTALAGFNLVKRDGIFALIHKASEGTDDPDNRYDARRAKWMSGSIIPVTDVDGTKLELSPLFGAYHFFHGVNAAAEAKYFLMMTRLASGDLPFIDWEEVGASGYQPSLELADAFCCAVEDALGRVCGVYGGNVPRERFAAEKPSSTVLDRFQARPLWFCGYGGVQDLNELPEPWTDVGAFLWQDDGDRYGPGPHTIPGISGYCDNSTVVAPMTFATLHARWLAGGVVSKPGPSPAPEAKVVGGETLIEKLEDEVKTFTQHIQDEIKELKEHKT